MKTLLNRLNARRTFVDKNISPLIELATKNKLAIRLTTVLLMTALLLPVVYFGNRRTVSAASSAPNIQPPAPVSAPPTAFVSNSSDTLPNIALSAVMAINQSLTNGYQFIADSLRSPQLPEGLAMAKVPTVWEKASNWLSSSLSSFVTPLFFVSPNNSSSTVEPNAPAAPLLPPQGTTTFDFDGDGKADVSRWQTAGEWKIKTSSTGTFSTLTTLGAGTAAAPADYDGDGITDRAAFTDWAGRWKIRKSSTGTDEIVEPFGQAGDRVVSGNYDGDINTAGIADLAVWRPANGTWYVRQSSNNFQIVSMQFGAAGDIPVPGNYDGDGKMDYAVFRPSTGVWYLRLSASNYADSNFQWGIGSDIPVPADYDGDGKTDFAVYRPSSGNWYAYKSSTNNGSYLGKIWGNYGDQPVPADYDGDGKADFAVWRLTTGVWYLVKSSDPTFNTYAYEQLGIAGDVAAPSAYLKQIGGQVLAYNLANARLSPKNATGGTDFYSRNFGWGTGLVGLSGRAGLDAGFGISYNSLVWTKEPTSNTMVFDADNSNVSPGFRFGFPTIEAPYFNGLTEKFSYLMVTPSGGRVEFRQNAASNIYETADSSYAQLTVNAPQGVTATESLTLTLTTTDGTQMNYSWKAGAYRLNQIKDRNGNFITVVYDDQYGLLRSVTDTLGRIITVEYDAEFYPTAIKQDWKTNNGEGSGTVAHTYATFTYGYTPITPNFGTGIGVFGPSGGTNVKVLSQITYPSSGNSTTFEYNAYGQVWRVRNVAADSSLHVLNSVRTDLQTPSVGASPDCPRFSETYNYVENFNGGNETFTRNTLTPNQTFTAGGETLSPADEVEVWMVGAPHSVRSKTYYHAAGNWQEGLPFGSEDIANGARKRWTRSVWTQDAATLYKVNPRVTESKVGDETNTKKMSVNYLMQDGSTMVSRFGLVSEVKVYDSNQTTVLKRATTVYNLAQTYLDRRIIGLPSEQKLYDQSDNPMSKVTYTYDEGDFTGTEQNISSVIQHDNTNYGASFTIGRGNLTSTTRHDVTGQITAITSSVKYNTAGAPVSQTDPLGRTVKISYADSFNDDINTRNTFAYPTGITTAGTAVSGEITSYVKYRFDIGANVKAESPGIDGAARAGKRTERIFDSVGRLERETLLNNGAYTRYQYFPIQTQSKVFTTVKSGAGEVESETITDGVGRVLKSRTPMNFNADGTVATWTGQKIEYDILGQATRSSVPTEVNANWNLAGDDATRGTWLWTHRKYDWKGRVTREINTDGTDSPVLNDSDKLIAYEGCGCAGGQMTIIQGERVAVPNQANTFARRTQKIYEDVQGRVWKTEVMNWDGITPYTTSVTEFNGRDQAVSVKQYAGAASSSNSFQETTMTYDGFGRLRTEHRPEQDANKYTTYNYNADDSIESVTDARGAKMSYGYNNRGQVNLMNSAVPEGADIPLASSVSFDYDALGNRIWMEDGLGRVDYEYNELSQLTAEIRQFSDSLPNAPPNNKYRLEYTYELSGQLKSYKEPFGQQINYTNDKIGRLGAVTGISSAGTTNYASNAEYRAWGALKHLDYGNGTAMNVGGFNNKLQATTFELKRGATQLMSKQYEFYSDGMVKKETDALDRRFDRSYEYDQMARMVEARTGAEARGEPFNPVNIPYRHSYQYDAFGNMIRDLFGQYSFRSGDLSQTFQNNRQVTTRPNAYDAEGNALIDIDVPVKSYKYDASGKISYTLYQNCGIPCVTDEQFLSYDGDGMLVKKKASDQINEEPPEVETVYSLRSSVLGGEVILEVGETGAVKRFFVRANGTVVATQENGGTIWSHKDLNLNSIRATDANGQIIGTGTGTGDTDKFELDPAGKNVEFSDPYNGDPYNNYPLAPTDYLTPFPVFGNFRDGLVRSYMVDGVSVPASHFDRMTEFAFGGMFGIIEQQSRLSTREVGRWYRRTITPDRGGSGESDDDPIRIGSDTGWRLRSIVYDTSWAGNFSLLSFSQQSQQYPFTQRRIAPSEASVLKDSVKTAVNNTDLCKQYIKDLIEKVASNAKLSADNIISTDILQLFDKLLNDRSKHNPDFGGIYISGDRGTHTAYNYWGAEYGGSNAEIDMNFANNLPFNFAKMSAHVQMSMITDAIAFNITSLRGGMATIHELMHVAIKGKIGQGSDVEFGNAAADLAGEVRPTFKTIGEASAYWDDRLNQACGFASPRSHKFTNFKLYK